MVEKREHDVLKAVTDGFDHEGSEHSDYSPELAMAITKAIMKLPCFVEVDIEQELGRLYDGCHDDRLKLDVLMELQCLRITLAEMKKEAAK